MVTSTNNLNNETRSIPDLGSTSRKEIAETSDIKMQNAINAVLGMLDKLAGLTVSLGFSQSSIQKEGVARAQARLEMYHKLLDAQTRCQNKDMFKSVVKGWSQQAGKNFIDDGLNNRNLDDLFMNWLDSVGHGDIFREFYENPSVSKEDKMEFARQFSTWYKDSNGKLSGFLGLSSPISANLQDASNKVQEWQTFADSRTPTTIQQAISTQIAEFGQLISSWNSVVGM